jgi:hypothetical protein
MLEVSGMFGWLAAALLFAAAAAWLKLGFSSLQAKRLDGRTPPESEDAENASRLLAIAFGVSACAAIVAITGTMFG